MSEVEGGDTEELIVDVELEDELEEEIVDSGAGKIAPASYAPKDPDEQRRAFVLETMASGAIDFDIYTVIESLSIVDKWLVTGDRPRRKRTTPETSGKVIQMIQKD